MLIFFGTFLLITKGRSISFSLGDIFVLIEAVLLAFGNSILGKMATNRMSPNISASASFLVGIFPIALIALFKGVIAIPQMPLLVLAFALVNILIITFRFLAYKNATASYVTMMFSLTPVFVSFIAIPFLGETLTSIQQLNLNLNETLKKLTIKNEENENLNKKFFDIFQNCGPFLTLKGIHIHKVILDGTV